VKKARIIRSFRRARRFPDPCFLTLPTSRKCPYNARVNRQTKLPSTAYNPSLDNLRSLLLIRGIALLGQAGVLAYVLFASHTAESLWGVTSSLLVLVIITALSLWRCTRQWPVTDNEFLSQLLIDVVGWTVLMYFSGGANNPFVSYYIVPLVIAAAVLPWRHTWLVAGASLAAYSALLYYYQPFPMFTPHTQMGHEDGTNVHILGMWFNFLFSAGLITYFVVRMASMLRQQDARAVALREDRLRDDQIMAVASLAAGTAHELGTPLATMTVLVDEMLQDDSLGSQAREDCELLQRQLAQCKSTLNGLTRTAELTSVQQTLHQPLDVFVRETVERWSVRRPGVVYELNPETKGPGPDIEYDSTLCQAVENLLNNAADSGSEKIVVNFSWDERNALISIRDWGPGIGGEMLKDMGKPIIRASPRGLGIGLLLSHATVERYGGRIELLNASEGGTEARLYLPVGRRVQSE
jgi:two-component system sensor histidine kinase RegB